MMGNMCVLLSLLPLLPPVRGQVVLTSELNSMNLTVNNTEIRRTWEKAQEFCRRSHTDLITITNETENKFIDGVYGWIGLYRENENSPWKWSRGNETAHFFAWAKGEPKDNSHCGYKKMKCTKWSSLPCKDAFAFICSDEKLVLVRENKTWEEALKYCRSTWGEKPDGSVSPYLNHRYDLASLTTQDDYVNARTRAQEATTDEVWTGLRFLAGRWFWAGGEEVQHRDLQSCPALMSCGVLVKSGNTFYQIRDCKEKRNFICYKRP